MTASSQSWTDPQPLQTLRSADLEQVGVVFSEGAYLYRTLGEKLGHGGMGNVYSMQRRLATQDESEEVVAKVFRTDYMLQLRTDPLFRREHEQVMQNLNQLHTLHHSHTLPTYLCSQIADNYLLISPRRMATLREVIARGLLSPRRKVELLMQAMSGLSSIHNAGFLHRDFTLRNILVDSKLETACLFDFDLTLSLAEVANTDYKTRFAGRIFGSPGYSMAPEVLDSVLMTSPINQSLDIYALGTSIYALFTEDLPYGQAEDMWSLLLRVSEGVVRDGQCFIPYPDTVPEILRPIIEACMQRTPSQRPKSAEVVIKALSDVLPGLRQKRNRVTSSFRSTIRYGDKDVRLKSVGQSRKDQTVPVDLIADVDRILEQQGYQLQRSLGKIKGNAIFLATPDPHLVALGRFPDDNAYPKIVTALNMSGCLDRASFVEKWMTRYQPALRLARQGHLTSLFRVVYAAEEGILLLLSEHVEDARFGTDLQAHILDLEEAFALGVLVAGQIARLHDNGLAHNNVSAEALLLKGNRSTRRVYPAMVGIVDPSFHEANKAKDGQDLATLLLQWISKAAIAAAAPHLGERLADVVANLQRVQTEHAEQSSLQVVGELCKDGLSILDYNFGVLREHGGDLTAYSLQLTSHSLFGRLWA